MHLTQNLAELCALLVEDIYGELPSRIITALLSKGRSTIQQLSQYTALTPRQIRHSLVVLLQNGFLYYTVGRYDIAAYSANAAAIYNIVRAGSIVEAVGNNLGKIEQVVLQRALGSGHVNMQELLSSCAAQGLGENVAHLANGYGKTHEEDDIAAAILDLIDRELLVQVVPEAFSTPADTRQIVEERIGKVVFGGEVKGTKGKEEFANMIADELRDIRDRPLKLKRKLGDMSRPSKRRKLLNGDAVNGDAVNGGRPDDDVDEHAAVTAASSASVKRLKTIEPDVEIAVNVERVVVELRNQRLAAYAGEYVGETSAQVYATLLQRLSRNLSRCQHDARLDGVSDEADKDLTQQPSVSTGELLELLDPSIDLFTGLGKVPPDSIDKHTAMRVIKYPPDRYVKPPDEAEVVGEASSDEDMSDAPDLKDASLYSEVKGNEALPTPLATPNQDHINGTSSKRPPKVSFDDTTTSTSGPPKPTPTTQLRQHLLVLCSTRLPFLRHSARDTWTIDFPHLITSLRTIELDTIISRSVGTIGLRLVRILRAKGKLDEKTLQSLALIPKGDCQKLLLRMQMAGFVDIQEVPRDNNRSMNRALFFYWHDTERCVNQVLDNTYKTMSRCLQVLKVQRHKERDVLVETEREDVRGKERELLEERALLRWEAFKEREGKLLGQVGRLDDLVGLLRDF